VEIKCVLCLRRRSIDIGFFYIFIRVFSLLFLSEMLLPYPVLSGRMERLVL